MTQVAEHRIPPRAAPETASTDRAAEDQVLARGPSVELNAFQILMRRWSKLHAYNAGQVMQISGRADREQWKFAVESVIGELGLGKPKFSPGDETVQFVPVQDVAIENVAGAGGLQELENFFNEELNRPFAAGDLPIRFCVLPAEVGADGEESHYLAAVYDHWIADSRAMRELMQRIFERYRTPRAAEVKLPPLTLEAPAFRKLFRKQIGLVWRLTVMIESLKNIWRHRGGYRLNLFNPLDFTSRILVREFPEGLIERLYRYAKSRGASVNDLFIATIAQTMGAHTAADRLGRARKVLHFGRRQVGIGTIVDIRDAASEPLDGVFNLYLSSYTILLNHPEKKLPEDLTQEIAAETRSIKKKHGTVKGYCALEMARFWYDVYDTPRFQSMLLHKTVPVCAGISNVNMTGSWADRDAAGDAASNGEGARNGGVPRVLDYLRISPTGPLIPVVFTLTTIGGRLSLCVTHRATAFNPEKLRRLVDDFAARLAGLGEAAA